MNVPLVATPFVVGGIILAVLFVFGQSYTYYESTTQVLSGGSNETMTRERPDYNPETIEFLVHQKVNEYRTANNATVIFYDPNIADIARAHSLDMATRNYFDHDSPEGIGPDQRGINGGYDICGEPESVILAREFKINQEQNNAEIRELNQKIQSHNDAIKQYNERQDQFRDFRDFQPNQEFIDRQEYIKLNNENTILMKEDARLNSIADQLDYQHQELQGMVYVGFSENLMSGFTYSEIIYQNGEIIGYEWYTNDGLAQSVLDAWINSPEHNDNLLDFRHTMEGIGITITTEEQILVTQNFC